MNGPQHYAAAEKALAKAESESGPRGDAGQLDKHMRLHAAHLAMAQFALDVAVNADRLFDGMEMRSEQLQARTDAMYDNRNNWIAAITEDRGVS
ncbi:hypothetical protein Caci_2883 [Catenulispora acidiphila DSM 44928]|uniref:Uncharacterized protein n=1 Tax=Catenulispora acidiphila (strain DSM 44928 / JCM 14897 / NBRC 102108 / NRRL B-24433 / ID139908) TaxID=479433 RepID=C7Q2Q0_CATAD|nr:hypothetical protein [Catenulispora acidiphila]ACU71792.1 hypothetical protein Caci_2883 [Catenulispora acidiphila DSM 44928]